MLRFIWFCRLDKLGALEWNKIVHGNEAWRLISCIWLHAGVIHLLANMLSLVFIGIRLEQQFGFGKYLEVPDLYFAHEYVIQPCITRSIGHIFTG